MLLRFLPIDSVAGKRARAPPIEATAAPALPGADVVLRVGACDDEG